CGAKPRRCASASGSSKLRTSCTRRRSSRSPPPASTRRSVGCARRASPTSASSPAGPTPSTPPALPSALGGALGASAPAAPARAPRAHVGWGRTVSAFGRHDEPARHLQMALVGAAQNAAALTGEAVGQARRLLVRELAALGYRDAARAVLEPLRALDPELPSL